MKITGKIIKKTASEKGIDLQVHIWGDADQQKNVLETLDKWTVFQTELKLNFEDDSSKKKITPEEDDKVEAV